MERTVVEEEVVVPTLLEVISKSVMALELRQAVQVWHREFEMIS